MPQIINTNVASLTAQRNLNSSQNALNTSLQRLSSGLRINSAKDDAAGLAISERFTTQIRGLNQASRNANDAISLSQTAEGALGEVGNNLQRIRELAVQSANATNSASDRAALDLEVQQRLAEIDRIASQTSFNGQKILDGSFGTAQFQVGANVGETISLDLSASTRTNSIGQSASVTGTTDIGSLIGTGLKVDAGDIAITIGVTTTNVAAGTYATANDLATAINTAHGTSGGTTALATVSGGEIQFTNEDGSDVTIAGADAVTLGFDGTVNAVATATENVAAGNFNKFEISDLTFNDGTTTASVAAGVYTAAELDTAIDNLGLDFTDITVSSTATSLSIANGAGGSEVFTVSGADATTLGIAGAINDSTTVTSGAVFNQAEITDLTVGYNGAAGTTVTSGGYTAAQLVSAINGLDTANPAVSDGAGGVNVISTNTAGGAATIEFTGVDAGTYSLADITTTISTDISSGLATELAATNPITLASGQFTVQVGTASAVSIVGTFSSGDELATLVNSAVDGAVATYESGNGFLSIQASEDITLGTSDTTLTDLGFSAGANTVTGDLTSVTVSSVTGANDTIFRIDSALTSVSDLRSTFGAVQNRFESTISNLSTAVESLSAARSRIQDADFASETAALTRAQILQQAGVSILSQANSLPQSVLGLLQ